MFLHFRNGWHYSHLGLVSISITRHKNVARKKCVITAMTSELVFFFHMCLGLHKELKLKDVILTISTATFCKHASFLLQHAKIYRPQVKKKKKKRGGVFIYQYAPPAPPRSLRISIKSVSRNKLKT